MKIEASRRGPDLESSHDRLKLVGVAHLGLDRLDRLANSFRRIAALDDFEDFVGDHNNRPARERRDIAFVQSWLGHANMATTKLYDRRRSRPEDSPTFKVSY